MLTLNTFQGGVCYVATAIGFPRIRGHKALVVAFLLDALGTGLYLPFSLLYFQKIAGLALPAIGVTLTIATILTLPMTPITGTLVDRFGGKPLVLISQLFRGLASWATLSSTIFQCFSSWHSL